VCVGIESEFCFSDEKIRSSRYLTPKEQAQLRQQSSKHAAAKAAQQAVLDSRPSSSSSSSSSSSKHAQSTSNNAVDSSSPRAEGYTILDQVDLYTHVFVPAAEAKLPFKFEAAVLTDYLRSLHIAKITPAPFLYEMLVNLFVKRGRYHQLHQFLQYHAILDSVHVACQLLSLETVYKPSSQMALDMLSRLATASTRDQIVEVLLARGNLLAALRFFERFKEINPPVKRFLELAVDDDCLFYTSMLYFQQRGLLTAECRPYTVLFKQRYSTQNPLPPSF